MRDTRIVPSVTSTRWTRTGSTAGRVMASPVRRSNADPCSVETCFRRAIKVAQAQCAKALELRATTSLARLLRDADRRDEARAMLAEIYNWFTEGFDTNDLKDAKVLLDELGA